MRLNSQESPQGSRPVLELMRIPKDRVSQNIFLSTSVGKLSQRSRGKRMTNEDVETWR